MKLIGHRGQRGFTIENTLAGISSAIESGCKGIELDIVVSKDLELVVSHEPFFIPETTYDCEKIVDNNLYNKHYLEIKSINVGRPHPLFPLQQPTKEHKPKLLDVIDLLNNSILDNDFLLLIEIKSEEKWYDTYLPNPDLYTNLILDFLSKKRINCDFMLQSFDLKWLNVFSKKTTNYPLGVLVEKHNDFVSILEKIDFSPSYFNPKSSLLTSENYCVIQSKGIEVIPWTVNSFSEIQRLDKIGVKKVITDYPNLDYIKKHLP